MRSLLVVLAVVPGAVAPAADAPTKYGYTDTPVIPGQAWRVHDIDRPQPPEVDPGTGCPPAEPGTPPADAVVLFGGRDLSKWVSARTGEAAPWKVENGYMEAAGGDIRTKDAFGDCQLHVEWATPDPPRGDAYNRGNSGIFLFGLYEIQVFESYRGGIYADGQAGAIYGQFPPLVNASRPPGAWQVYDILFTAPRFRDGTLVSPAYLTLLHNGVVIHNHTALTGPTQHRAVAAYSPHDPSGPIVLQDHGNPVRVRNVWVRPLKGYDEP